MTTDNTIPKDTDEYIAGFPASVQELLQTVRTTIKSNAPQAVEVISYGMPAFKLHGMLAYFAAYTHHIGFYPGASGIAACKEDLSGFKNAKGTVQFPFDKPIPVDLIAKMIQYRVIENTEKAEAKKKKKH